MYNELFISQIRTEYCLETKAKLGFFFFSSQSKDSFFPLPEFPHRLENGPFYFNRAFGKMLANHKCGLQAHAPKELITAHLRNI